MAGPLQPCAPASATAPFRGAAQWARRAPPLPCRSPLPDHASFHLRPRRLAWRPLALAPVGHQGVLAQNADGSDPTSPALSEVQVREASGSSGYQGARATRRPRPHALAGDAPGRARAQQLIEAWAPPPGRHGGLCAAHPPQRLWRPGTTRHSPSDTDGAACSTALRRAGAMARSARGLGRAGGILKGPAAALYGSSGRRPLNVVTKKPQFPPQQGGREVGPWAIGVPRSTARPAGHRCGLPPERGARRRRRPAWSQPQDGGPRPSPGTWAPTGAELRGRVHPHPSPLDRGIVQVNGNAGALPRDRYLGDPTQQPARERDTHQFTLDHDLGQGWRRAWAPRRETACTAKPWT